MKPTKVAIIHYWLTGMRGGEKVIESICEIFPDADIYTLAYDRKRTSETINRHNITTSFLQNLGGRKIYQYLLPLAPRALENFDLSKYDLVISSESGPAKGIITGPETLHICYCHSPMRYLWDMAGDYEKSSHLAKFYLKLFGPKLRNWDFLSAQRVDYFIANSSYIAARIEKYYRRPSTVIHPPVNTENFSCDTAQGGEYYLMLGQITPYKKVELAIEAFTVNKRKLHIVGRGMPTKLKKKLPGNISLQEEATNDQVNAAYKSCKALIYPGKEDFGIIPIEAMASGKPVIAYGKGGVLDTIIPNITGVFFQEQSALSMNNAILEFESKIFNPEIIRAHALKFSKNSFKAAILNYIDAKAPLVKNADAALRQ